MQKQRMDQALYQSKNFLQVSGQMKLASLWIHAQDPRIIQFLTPGPPFNIPKRFSHFFQIPTTM